jgi:hypothetical protein
MPWLYRAERDDVKNEEKAGAERDTQLDRVNVARQFEGRDERHAGAAFVVLHLHTIEFEKYRETNN